MIMRKILIGNELLIIFFRIAGATFGIDIQNVVSVLDNTNVRKVPLAPEYMNSIRSCHGEILTIFDIKTYFKYKDTVSASEKKIIYLNHPRLHTGILVDKVINIDYVLQSYIEPIPDENTATAEAGFCKEMFVLQEDEPGIYRLDTKLIETFVDGLDLS